MPGLCTPTTPLCVYSVRARHAVLEFEPYNSLDVLRAQAAPPAAHPSLRSVYGWQTLLAVEHRPDDPDGAWWLKAHAPQTLLALNPSAMRFFPFRQQDLRAAQEHMKQTQPAFALDELARFHVPPLNVYTAPFWVLLTSEAAGELFPVTAPAPLMFGYYRTLLQLMTEADWVGELADYQQLIPAWVREPEPARAREVYARMVAAAPPLQLPADDDALRARQQQEREQCAARGAPPPAWADAELSCERARELYAAEARYDPLPDDDDQLRAKQLAFERMYAGPRAQAEREGKRRVAIQQAWNAQLETLLNRYEPLLAMHNRRLHDDLRRVPADNDAEADAMLHIYAVRLLQTLESMLMAIMSVPVCLRQELHTPIQQPPASGGEFRYADNERWLEHTSLAITEQILLNRNAYARELAANPPPADAPPQPAPTPTNHELLAVHSAADYRRMLVGVVRGLTAAPSPTTPVGKPA